MAVAVAEAIAMAGAVPETVWGMVSVCGWGCGCGCVAVGAGCWVPGGCWVVGFVVGWVVGWVGGCVIIPRPDHGGQKRDPILVSNF